MTDDNVPAKPNGDATKHAPCCATCLYYFPFAGNVSSGTCRFNAPMPVMIGIRQSLVGQEPQPRVDGFFPGTSVNVVCGRHPDWDQYVEMRRAAAAEYLAKQQSDERQNAESEAAGRA